MRRWIGSALILGACSTPPGSPPDATTPASRDAGTQTQDAAIRRSDAGVLPGQNSQLEGLLKPHLAAHRLDWDQGAQEERPRRSQKRRQENRQLSQQRHRFLDLVSALKPSLIASIIEYNDSLETPT